MAAQFIEKPRDRGCSSIMAGYNEGPKNVFEGVDL